MMKLFLKIFRTENTIVPIDIANDSEDMDLVVLGEQIKESVKKLFGGSLAIRQIDGGSDNACEQELVALSNSFYDVERFGIHFVASPRHADMLLVTGPVTRNIPTVGKRRNGGDAPYKYLKCNLNKGLLIRSFLVNLFLLVIIFAKC